MGIGSFFASLFHQENDSRKEIRELNMEPAHKERASAGGERVREKSPEKSSESTRKHTPNHSAGESPEKTGDRLKADSPGKSPEDRNPVEHKKASVENMETAAGRKPSENKDEKRQARKEYFQAKKDLYYYLNQTMRTLCQADREDAWETLPPFEGPSGTAVAALDKVREELPSNLKELMDPFFDEKNMQVPAGLQPAFFSMMLPFYPSYREEFGEFQYNTFLNRDALELYRRLTGRKFRLGYRNRYEGGTAAFEWEGDRYRVYNSSGVLLCDAVFENGSIKEGYAAVPGQGDDPDWTVLRKGFYHDGEFSDGAVEYVYRKPVDL